MKHVNPAVREAEKILEAYLSQPISIYAAAVAYYTVFSLAPILIIAIAVTGFFLRSAHSQEIVLSQFTGTFGSSGGDFIRTLTDAQSSSHSGIIATVIGIIFVILGASGIFGALETALTSIFSSLPQKRTEGLIATLWQRIASIGMVLSVGFVLLASLAISALLNVVGSHINAYVPEGSIIIGLLGYMVTYILVSLFLGMLIKFLPNERLPWRPALLGGFVAGAGFILGKYLLSLYFAYSSAASAYGAAGAVVLIILWAFYLSQVFFLAAIITKLYFLPEGAKT